MFTVFFKFKPCRSGCGDKFGRLCITGWLRWWGWNSSQLPNICVETVLCSVLLETCHILSDRKKELAS